MIRIDQVGRWQSLRHAPRGQKLLRLTIVLAPVAAVGAMAADGVVWVPLALVVAALAIGCALLPDSHLGLLTVLVVGIWHGATVESAERATTLVVTLCLATLHLAMAAATVAPVAAHWSPLMRRRWLTRAAVVAGIGMGAWTAALVLDGRSPFGRAPVLVATLLVAALTALVLRAGALGRAGR